MSENTDSIAAIARELREATNDVRDAARHREPRLHRVADELLALADRLDALAGAVDAEPEPDQLADTQRLLISVMEQRAELTAERDALADRLEALGQADEATFVAEAKAESDEVRTITRTLRDRPALGGVSDVVLEYIVQESRRLSLPPTQPTPAAQQELPALRNAPHAVDALFGFALRWMMSLPSKDQTPAEAEMIGYRDTIRAALAAQPTPAALTEESRDERVLHLPDEAIAMLTDFRDTAAAGFEQVRETDFTEAVRQRKWQATCDFAIAAIRAQLAAEPDGWQKELTPYEIEMLARAERKGARDALTSKGMMTEARDASQ